MLRRLAHESRKLFSLLAITSGILACNASDRDDLSDLRIVGGGPVAQSQLDLRRHATVALTTDTKMGGGKSPLDSKKSFCTGTIIRRNAIVTAAHCLQAFDPGSQRKLSRLNLAKESDFIVFFGTEVGRDGQWVRAQRVIPHPEWDPSETLSEQPTTRPNDIGLVVLEGDIPDSAKIAKIAEPSKLLAKGDELHLVGFGVTESRSSNDTGIMRQVSTPVTESDPETARVTVGAHMRGACAGDSGGPAYIQDGATFELVGATSTGAEIGGKCYGVMNVYTDVRQYLDWIEEVLGH